MSAEADEPNHPRSNWRSWISALAERLKRFKPLTSRATRDADGSPPSAPEGEFASLNGQLSNAGDFNPAPRESEDLDKPSDEVFLELGALLRQRREMLSLTHDEVERHIRVRAAFLKSLEDGTLDALPSPVQTRGILANYAGFLDLDVDTILLRFAEGLQARLREQKLQTPSRTRTPMTVNTSLPPLRSFIASDLLFGGGMAIMLLLFAIWGISRVISVRSSISARATSPSISDVLAGTALPAPPNQVTVVAAQATPVVSGSQSAASLEPPTLGAGITVQINLEATGRTFMRITVDDKVQFEGRSEPGQSYSYQAGRQIEVLVGDAAALKVTFNGRDLGLMGGFGEVLDRLYTEHGVVTPTATLPPTRTPTPNFTATPSLTPTRTPTVTPTPKP
jgi:cytoskeletal protein RodZ